MGIYGPMMEHPNGLQLKLAKRLYRIYLVRKQQSWMIENATSNQKKVQSYDKPTISRIYSKSITLI